MLILKKTKADDRSCPQSIYKVVSIETIWLYIYWDKIPQFSSHRAPPSGSSQFYLLTSEQNLIHHLDQRSKLKWGGCMGMKLDHGHHSSLGSLLLDSWTETTKPLMCPDCYVSPLSFNLNPNPQDTLREREGERGRERERGGGRGREREREKCKGVFSNLF